MGAPALVEKQRLSLQASVSARRYILDFVCLPQQVIVEVDGGQHNSGVQLTKDKARDDHFRKLGFRILRFWNNEVEKNLSGVLN